MYSHNTYDGVPVGDELVSVDPTGEVKASFSGLLPHDGSGLQRGWPR